MYSYIHINKLKKGWEPHLERPLLSGLICFVAAGEATRCPLVIELLSLGRTSLAFDSHRKQNHSPAEKETDKSITQVRQRKPRLNTHKRQIRQRYEWRSQFHLNFLYCSRFYSITLTFLLLFLVNERLINSLFVSVFIMKITLV